VQRVFKLTLQGMGEHKIAALFNGEGVPVMGRGRMWHRSTISKMLRNDATIGTLTPALISYSTGKRQRLFEAPIEGAYPAVISQADWSAVQALKKGGASVPRGRGATKPLANLFAGLARCPECGAAMTRVHKAGGAKPRLVCTRAKAGAATHGYHSIYQDVVEAAFLSGWQGLLIDVPAGTQGNTLDTECNDLQGVIWETEERLEQQMAVFDRSPTTTVASHIRSLELQLDSLRSDLKAIKDRCELTDGGLIQARIEMLADALGHHNDEPEPINVAKVNAILKVLFSGIIVDYLSGKIRFQWRQGGEGAVTFAWPS
jgi:Recombinase/Recombinase zinc beta ribbon domain